MIPKKIFHRTWQIILRQKKNPTLGNIFMDQNQKKKLKSLEKKKLSNSKKVFMEKHFTGAIRKFEMFDEEFY